MPEGPPDDRFVYLSDVLPTAWQVIDPVGMEAHGAPVARLAHRLAGLLPDRVAQQMMETAGVDRLASLHMVIEIVQRGGTISADPLRGESYATHRLPLEEAPHAYDIFQNEQDGAFKILLKP